MADTPPITAKITAVSQKGDGFKVVGYDNWFNLSNDYQGVAVPSAGTEIEFTYKPWLNPKSHKTAYYVDEIIPVTQVPAPTAAAPAAAPTPAAAAEPPRTGPGPVPEDAGPVLGTHASTELSIQRQVALKTAIEYLVGAYGGAASEEKPAEELDGLITNALYVARGLAPALQPAPFAGAAMPDDTLVPTPSEMAAPLPEFRGE